AAVGPATGAGETLPGVSALDLADFTALAMSVFGKTPLTVCTGACDCFTPWMVKPPVFSDRFTLPGPEPVFFTVSVAVPVPAQASGLDTLVGGTDSCPAFRAKSVRTTPFAGTVAAAVADR